MPDNHSSDAIYVFCGCRLVGKITRIEGGIDFNYDRDWIGFGYAISNSLPLNLKSLGEEKRKANIRHFFENLLPSGLELKHHARAAKVDPNDLFGLLKTMLHESTGALIFSDSPKQPYAETLKVICKIPIQEYLQRREAGHIRTMRGIFSNGDTLTGAQDKLSCIVSGNEVFVPETGSACIATHILKPSWSFSVNEHFCLRFGEKCGLNTVKSQIVRIGNDIAVAIQRYDRLGGLRLHQEDFCQALGLPDFFKYECDSVGANYEEIADLARKILSEDACEKIAALTIFNIIIGNGDAHAKNLSLLRNLNNKLELAPFYDLNNSEIEGFDDSMALRIGNAKNFAHLNEDSFVSLAYSFGLELEKMLQISKQMISMAKVNLAPHTQLMIEEIPEREEYIKQLSVIMQKNIMKLEKHLSELEKNLLEEDSGLKPE